LKPFGYTNRLKDEISRWQELGLLAEPQGEALLQDIDARRSKRSFGYVFAILGAVLIAAALVAFVAANWNELSKLVRVALLMSSIWVSYLIAYISSQRHSPVIAQAFYVIAIAAFGTSIMLIGQIYQLQGRYENALFLWMLGGLATTVAARSSWALVYSAGISGAWMIAVFWSGWSETSTSEPPFWTFGANPFNLYPIIFLAIAALAVWLRSQVAGHVLMVAALIWSALFGRILEGDVTFRVVLITAIALIAMALVLRDITNQRRLGGFGTSAIGYLVVFLFAFVLADLRLFGEYIDRTVIQSTPVLQVMSADLRTLFVYDYPFVIAIFVTLAIAVWMKQRGETLLRDQWVIPIAGLVLVIARMSAIQLMSAEFVLFSVVAMALCIWTIRFGWRLEARFVSAVGYLSFAAVLLITYDQLFGSLINTAAFYALAGVGLLATAVVLLRRERRSAATGAS